MSQSRTPNLEGGQAPDAGAQPIVTHLAWVTLPGPSSTTASAASSSPTLISPASLPCSSPSASHSAEHGDATPRGRLPAADAQPNGRSSLRAKDHSPPTSGDIQPGMMRDRGDGTTVEAGLTMEEATIFDQCEAQDRVTRAHAGQPAAKLTALTATSLLPRDAEGCPTVSYPAAMDEGVFTRRSSVETLVVGWGRSLDGDPSLDELPNEVLMHILSYLEVCELLDVSRVCWFKFSSLHRHLV
ncbi:uncharacterized protein BCR38DRAFT_73129 [Pseudomassariella vexata]|uniref:F-box domain-containing protein n=1 Tax=Pseudomassariella vexata TaxID=1141098 RepID=A0A1Y2DGR0_9PEZI|nr:uncharacterized protein BCR38DRAFT_73129 [Pseudomassariella vexata]ORY58439.1 hypothetical protein BCR38DRAFT_73129 [Pseudomassariella vexata]